MHCSNPDTFWITTGLFPQEFIVTFARKIVAKDISIKSTGGVFALKCPLKTCLCVFFFYNETVRRLQIEASNEDDHLGNFKLVVTKGERVFPWRLITIDPLQT